MAELHDSAPRGATTEDVEHLRVAGRTSAPPAAPPEDVYRQAEKVAAAHFDRKCREVEQALAPFPGWRFRGVDSARRWTVRDPKQRVHTAESPEALVRLVREACGKGATKPEQGVLL
jgi:hypothetical protein